MSELSKYWIH